MNGVEKIILWVARIWGTLILLFVLAFMVPGIFGEDAGEGLRDSRELLTFLFFPVSTLAGLGIAWRSEGLGGLIATVGIVGLFVVRPDLLTSLIFAGAIAPPGILFLLFWFLSRQERGPSPTVRN